MGGKFQNVPLTPDHHLLYREIGGPDCLRILDEPAPLPGMVMVARFGDDYESRPELKWRAWRDLLEPMIEGSSAPK